jgi:GDP-L-fucose synthase
MPTSLYGPGDNFDLANSHVIPALMRGIHEAKVTGAPSVTIWGTGTPRRELLHVDDMAAACIHVMELPREVYQAQTQPLTSHINVGTGQDVSIRELAQLIADVVDFPGELQFDPRKPDGAPRKLLEVSRLAEMGWTARIGLREGLESTYRWFLANQARLRA